MNAKTKPLPRAKKVVDEWDEKKKLITKVVKGVVKNNSVLPILEDVMISEGFLTVSDLETTVSIPFDCDINSCIPANKFLDCLGMMKKPQIREVTTETPIPIPEHWRLGEKIYDGEELRAKERYQYYLNTEPEEVTPFPEWCADHCTELTEDMVQQKFITSFHVELSEGKRVIKLCPEDVDQFPRLAGMGESDHEFNHIASFGEAEMDYIGTALKFVSNDDLRPAMTGIYFDKDIVATDAHRLYWHPIEPVMQKFILPAKAAKLLLAIGGTWELFGDAYSYEEDEKVVEMDAKHICFINEDGILLMTRVIDARYPNYEAVIPQGEGNYYLLWDSATLRKELQGAMKFANKCTNQVNFYLNGKASISCQDVDFGFEYQNELTNAEVQKKEGFDDLAIAFNAKMLEQILSELPNDEVMSMKMWAPNKGAIINQNFLIMPLMLNK